MTSTPSLRLPHLVALFATAGLLLLAGCVSADPFRIKIDNPRQHPTGQTIEPGDQGYNYTTGFVELDEMGWLWDQSGGQMRQVQDLIVQKSGLTSQTDKDHPAQSVILVAFVHGWKHNASPDDPNVIQFNDLLKLVETNEKTAHPDHPRPVVGVYLGWPGASSHVPYLENLTFYTRKNTGDRIGYLGGAIEVFSRLEKLHNLINASLPDTALRSVYVVAGHSFGAQVVYDALASTLTQRIVENTVAVDLAHPTDKIQLTDKAAEEASPRRLKEAIAPFGDMILLINPAFEASRYHNLEKLSRQFNYANDQRPVLAVFSSDTDQATKLAFPLGRLGSTLFHRYRSDDLHDLQAEDDHHTLPWVKKYGSHVTHTLKPVDPAAPAEKRTTFLSSREKVDSSTRYMADVKRVRATWNRRTRGHPITLGDCVLSPLDIRQPWTPFYVVKVDSRLMDGHGDIWRPSMEAFVAAFVAVTESVKPSTTYLAEKK